MRKKIIAITAAAAIVLFCSVEIAAGAGEGKPVELANYEDQASSARIIPARMDDKIGVAVIFAGTDDLHYYAKKETAAGGYNLTVVASGKGGVFGEALFPKWEYFFDSAQRKDVEVYVGNFTVFVPIQSYDKTKSKLDVEVAISGLACTSKICLTPFKHVLRANIDFSRSSSWKEISFDRAPIEGADATAGVVGKTSYSAPIAFLLALVAGLVLNIMPCVWPVIPIIVTRIWNQAHEKRARSMGLGLAFCGGILLFFAAIAIVNIILILVYGTVLQWGDQFRNPGFVTAMSLLMMVLGLFMFDVFSIGVPASVTSKAGGGSGYAGSVGMGFLAALLATPCSFAILAAAVAWAQTQTLPVATFTIMLIGVGMAVPYLVLVTMPGLLNRLPKPGGWMEGVKKMMGLLLFLIAVKLLGAVPSESRINVLYYAVVLGLCVWMWGGWVSYATVRGRKWLVRGAAVIIAVGAGFGILGGGSEKLIDWQGYDAGQITKAVEADQPVLIKFTADWCTTCTVVERFVYMRKDVAELVKQKGVLAIKADTTLADSTATIDLSGVYKEPGVPVTVLLLPGGGEKKLRGLIDKDDLKGLLNGLPDVRIDGQAQ